MAQMEGYRGFQAFSSDRSQRDFFISKFNYTEIKLNIQYNNNINHFRPHVKIYNILKLNRTFRSE